MHGEKGGYGSKLRRTAEAEQVIPVRTLAIPVVKSADPGIDLAPHNYDVMFNLAAMLREHAPPAEARPYIERFVREAPPQRYARDIAMFRRWLSEK